MQTKIEYIRECKEIWRKIKASRLSKESWLMTEDGKVYYNMYLHDCPLCDGYFRLGAMHNCPKCPLVEQYGKDCYDLGYNEDVVCPEEWFETIEGLKEV
jgi:hypothetical protein